VTEQAKRIAGFDELDDSQMCYWFDKDEGFWYLYLPYCGLANLSNHQVTEHEDGTITVSPSILLYSHGSWDEEKQMRVETKQRHGYLERGIWKEV